MKVEDISMYKISTNELYHHGVKGMKWGVRRYQNEDGTLTTLGKRVRKSKWNQPTVKQGKGKDNATPAQIVLKNANTMTNGGKQITSAAKRMQKTEVRDYSNLTDAEIRERVNRLNLERQLNQLETGNVRSGFDYASDILDITSGVIGIAGGIAGIMALMNFKRT